MDLSVENLGSVGEFVSSIVVIVTLAYLAVQTKLTQRMIRGQTRQAWAESTQFALLTTADSDHLPEIEEKLAAAGFPEDPEAIAVLNPVERNRYGKYLIGTTHRIRSHLYQVRIGLADVSMAPPRGMWEPRLRAFGYEAAAADLDQLYDAVSTHSE